MFKEEGEIAMKYEEFLTKYKRYEKFRNNKSMQKVFELITQPEYIREMIIASENDKPALTVCIEEIELLCEGKEDIDVSEDFTKQALGAMLATVLDPFGYVPIKSKLVSNSQYVKTAAVYSLNKKPIKRIETVSSIKPIEEGDSFEYVVSYKNGLEIAQTKKKFYSVTGMKKILRDILKAHNKAQKPTITLYLGAREWNVVSIEDNKFVEYEEEKQRIKEKFINDLRKHTYIDIEDYVNIEINTDTWRNNKY